MRSQAHAYAEVAMWTVIMKRGAMADVTRPNEDEKRARQRVRSLCELHGLREETMVVDRESQTITIDASDYYG